VTSPQAATAHFQEIEFEGTRNIKFKPPITMFEQAVAPKAFTIGTGRLSKRETLGERT
jgi:hypothetical protein